MRRAKRIFLLAALLVCVALAGSASAKTITVGEGKDYATLEEAIRQEGSADYEIYGKHVMGEGDFQGAGKSTFKGMTADAEIDVSSVPGGKSYGGVSEAAFEDLIFTTSNADYKGFHHSARESFVNCTINGVYWTYAPAVSFAGCTFNQSGKDPYCIWYYGGNSTMTLTNCAFYSDHKFVLAYNEGGGKLNIIAEGNRFYYKTPTGLEKAVFELDADNEQNSTIIDIALNAKNNVIDCRCPRGLWFDKTVHKNDTVTVAESGTREYHANLTHIAAKAAAAGQPGNVEHWICEVCSKYYLDADGMQETTADQVVIWAQAAAGMPSTGDASHLALYLALLAASACALAAVRRRQKAQ